MGDILEQQLEIYKNEIDKFDAGRTKNMAASGLVSKIPQFNFNLTSINFIVDSRSVLSLLVPIAWQQTSWEDF